MAVSKPKWGNVRCGRVQGRVRNRGDLHGPEFEAWKLVLETGRVASLGRSAPQRRATANHPVLGRRHLRRWY